MDKKPGLLKNGNVRNESYNGVSSKEELLSEPLLNLNEIKHEPRGFFIDTLDNREFNIDPEDNNTCVGVKSFIQLTSSDHTVDPNVTVGNGDNLLDPQSNTKGLPKRTQKCKLKNFNIPVDVTNEFVCKTCSKVFTTKIKLTRHVNEFHIKAYKKYACIKCNFRTNHRATLTRHSYTHESVKRFECALCEKQFIEKRSLFEHIRVRHSECKEEHNS